MLLSNLWDVATRYLILGLYFYFRYTNLVYDFETSTLVGYGSGKNFVQQLYRPTSIYYFLFYFSFKYVLFFHFFSSFSLGILGLGLVGKSEFVRIQVLTVNIP